MKKGRKEGRREEGKEGGKKGRKNVRYKNYQIDKSLRKCLSGKVSVSRK